MNKKCSFCGGEEFSQKRIEYIYRRGGKMMLVPNTPAEVCDQCGMQYFAGPVLESIERHFFAIENHQEVPDRYVQVPEKAFV